MNKKFFLLFLMLLSVFVTTASTPDSCDQVLVIFEEIPMAMQSPEKPVYKKDTLAVRFAKSKARLQKSSEKTIELYLQTTTIKHFGQIEMIGCSSNAASNGLRKQRKKNIAEFLEKRGIPRARIQLEE